MWSCLVEGHIYMIILIAVIYFNKGNRKVKKFLKLHISILALKQAALLFGCAHIFHILSSCLVFC